MKYNLSQIVRAANRFHKQGLTLSQAFRAAWKLAKANALSKVAGVTYGQRQTILQRIAADPHSVKVDLHREHGNHYDANAVSAVISHAGGRAKLGYLPARTAAYIAPLMDAGQKITATLSAVCGGYNGLSYGVRMNLSFQ